MTLSTDALKVVCDERLAHGIFLEYTWCDNDNIERRRTHNECAEL
jgi:hypothetical protein